MGNIKQKRLSNVIGFDDAPFAPNHVGSVPVVGTVFARLHLNGVLIGEVEKDGMDAAEQLTHLVARSRFSENVQLIMLQGIAMAGFNIVDVFYLHEHLNLPILVISRRLPDMEAIHSALINNIPGGTEKWALLERLGPMEQVEQIYVQRVGLTLAQATTAVKQFTVEGTIPEPLRTAHLIASALVEGQSHGRT
ncbi:MAG: DUF99 family protein [Anaerolineae bacterium]|nr:DUF99 family protein [Anaerolineae bacterium]